MNILIVNDDGVFAPGIRALATWAKKHGNVTVVAPFTEQSGKSHSIEIVKSFRIEPVALMEGVEAYGVDSSPADCVRYGISGLGRTYDVVLSGINRGFNIGDDIMYSGTVGAIFEASAYGHKAIAFSTDPATFDGISPLLDQAFDFIFENDLFAYSQIYNVNIPLASKGIRITRKGGPFYRDTFVVKPDGLYFQEGSCAFQSSGDLSIDTDAVMSGYTSILPLTCERTNMDAFSQLSAKFSM